MKRLLCLFGLHDIDFDRPGYVDWYWCRRCKRFVEL